LLKPNFKDIIQQATAPNAAPTLLITIFLGANDAVLIPLSSFEENIRQFVDDVLKEEGLFNTKIVLITPPPINIPEPVPTSDDIDLGPAMDRKLKAHDPKLERGYRAYMNKKAFADKILEIAHSYEGTGRVVGLNFWKALVDAALRDQDRFGAADAYDEDKLPGCGLPGAREFKQGYFSDGLHFEGLVRAPTELWG
jgi:isoamyl acetate esterase